MSGSQRTTNSYSLAELFRDAEQRAGRIPGPVDVALSGELITPGAKDPAADSDDVQEVPVQATTPVS